MDTETTPTPPQPEGVLVEDIHHQLYRQETPPVFFKYRVLAKADGWVHNGIAYHTGEVVEVPKRTGDGLVKTGDLEAITE